MQLKMQQLYDLHISERYNSPKQFSIATFKKGIERMVSKQVVLPAVSKFKKVTICSHIYRQIRTNLMSFVCRRSRDSKD